MESEGWFNSYIMDDSFSLEPVVHPDSSQNLPMFYDSSDQNILENNASDYPLTLDQRNNASLISPNDVNSARNNLGAPIGCFDNNVDSSFDNVNQENMEKADDQFVISQTHNNVYPQNYPSPNQMEPCNNFPSVVEEHGHSVNVDRSSADQAKSRQRWTAGEDQKLIDLVNLHGEDWSRIAKMFSCRTGKQCREKWYNSLRPGIKKDHWSEQEDRILIEAHEALGTKWSEIASRLPGRTENCIKNRWYSHKRKYLAGDKYRSRSRTSGSSLLRNHMPGLVQFPAADENANMPDAVQQTSYGDQGASSSSNLSNSAMT